jgi:pyruvate dehydrogenase E2 component (dihydrolipoamide acetyltransferase)
MTIEIRMPALSPTMTEGNLARWLKKEGDAIAPGDVIAEIETDKATMEVEAIDEGTLGRILVPEGAEGVAVNAVIGLLLEEGEDQAALEDHASNGGATAKPQAELKPESKAEGELPPAAQARPGEPAGRPADEAVQPEARKEPPAGRKAGNGAAERGDRIFASPLAKRMAEQAGIDLTTLQGSGPHGRIIKVDIERAIREGVPEKARPAAKARAPEAPRPAEAPTAPVPPAPMAPPTEPFEEIKLSNMRKVIARRLTEAKQQIPHYYLTIDCEIDALLGLRKELNAREGADYKLSVNDFLIKALALALRKVPAANRSWGGDRLYQYRDADISVAVAIPDGLITPIIRRADQKGLSTISKEMRELGVRARGGKLKPEEYQGGSFSISNLGMYGIREFAAVINPPQAGILAVGAGEQRPVVKDGALATATMMSATLAADHRVIDGAVGAELLAAFKGYVQDPLSMLL